MPPLNRTEALPFVVRPATTDTDLAALSALRAEAYARHDYLPGVSERLRSIDEADRRAILFVAEDKASGEITGTIRVSSSLRGATPIPEQMPREEFAGASFAYTDRFAARQGPLADVVALALIKAQWFCAYHEGVEWVVAAALPALARRYRMVGLRTLAGADQGRFHIPHLHTRPYEAVGERLCAMPANLRRAAPFLAPFFLEMEHPDILVEKPAGLQRDIEACAAAQQAEPERPGELQPQATADPAVPGAQAASPCAERPPPAASLRLGASAPGAAAQPSRPGLPVAAPARIIRSAGALLGAARA